MTRRPTLPQLQAQRQFDTDKSNPIHTFLGRSYLDVYEGLLADLRDRELTLVELGVLRGGSLRLWMEYFPRARVVGVDIDPGARAHVPEGATFILGSQTNERAITAVLDDLPPLGVVIDDGSHYVPHMLTSFRFLWPRVMDGGVYVMEDLCISYDSVDPGWPGMAFHRESFQPNRREELNALLFELIRKMDQLEGDVRSVEFHPMMVAIRKARRWMKPTIG